MKVSDITCIRSIDPDWCIHVVFCSTLPYKVLPFRCVILKYPCLHVTPQHMFNNYMRYYEFICELLLGVLPYYIKFDLIFRSQPGSGLHSWNPDRHIGR
jgi:hypothetical protein